VITRLANGVAIAYDDVGVGLPVVYLHGFPHNRTLWASQLSALAVPTRAIVCDLRGFGESDGAVNSVDEYADDVAGLMAALAIPKAVIAGLSMGGYVALAMWRRYPALVRALVLVDTRAGADDEAGRRKRTAQIALVRQNGSEALADVVAPGMLGKTTRAERPEIVQRVRAMLGRAAVPASVGALTAMRDRPDSTPTLATITVPTLVIVGEQDVLTPVADARAMHAGIQTSRIEIIAGAGHLSNIERPAAFNHVLSEFCASLTLM
jgi:pimeloyl-ACP methyl ester carboxylesterase